MHAAVRKVITEFRAMTLMEQLKCLSLMCGIAVAVVKIIESLLG